ncbi:hypothetical protein BD309DRAFT_957343 [Dichomitus squalens]|uniref:Uncharacterized protein n=1 Tax=Dichomitus squalens TaxID=114155 RepID=A0A4Q9NXP3_9APHY|nr:hypothetical protein BD309DRAFT_957343 [Dichomitus squalens]TBU54801.1 hypothetical protein BD310DRAFT_935111 [Dichomitus squalens]
MPGTHTDEIVRITEVTQRVDSMSISESPIPADTAQFGKVSESSKHEGDMEANLQFTLSKMSWVLNPNPTLLTRDLLSRTGLDDDGSKKLPVEPSIVDWSTDHCVLTIPVSEGEEPHKNLDLVPPLVSQSLRNLLSKLSPNVESSQDSPTIIMGTRGAAPSGLAAAALNGWHESQKPSAIQLLKDVEVNYLRCTGCDDIIAVSSEDQVSMSHMRFSSDVLDHWHNICGARRDVEETKYIENHTTFMKGLFLDNRWMDPSALQERLSQYPKSGFCDMALSVKVKDVLPKAAAEEPGSLVSRYLSDKCISFYSNLPINTEEFFLPVLLINSQKYGMNLDNTTRNLLRLNCVSAAKFLSTLGIWDFPVHGLVTYGSYGLPCVAWCPKDKEVVCITDRLPGGRHFDFSRSDSYSDFLKFSQDVYEHALKLKTCFESEKVQEELKLRIQSDNDILRWSVNSRDEDYVFWDRGDEMADENVEVVQEATIVIAEPETGMNRARM